MAGVHRRGTGRVRSLHPGRIDRVVQGLLAAVAIGCMGLVLWQNQETIRQISARRLDLRCFALALLITQVSLLITFVRWSLLVRVIEPGFTLRCSILLGFIGYLFNLVIPGAVGGDVVKAAYLSRMQIKKTQAIASMVLDRIVGLLGLFVLAATAGALPWRMATPAVRSLIVAAWAALGFAILVVAPLFFCPAMQRTSPRPDRRKRGRLSTIVAELQVASVTCGQRHDVLLASLVLSLISHGLNVMALFLIGKMLFSSRMLTTTWPALLDGAVDFFQHGHPASFWCSGFHRGSGRPAFPSCGASRRSRGHHGPSSPDAHLRTRRRLRLSLESRRDPRLQTEAQVNGTGTAARGSPPVGFGSPSR